LKSFYLQKEENSNRHPSKRTTNELGQSENVHGRQQGKYSTSIDFQAEYE
jgi:hypothetical protein